MIDIVRKTWAKMSPRGHAAGVGLTLSPGAAELVAASLAEGSQSGVVFRMFGSGHPGGDSPATDAGAPAAFSAGLTNASLDGGNLSSHGYVTLSSLPPGAVPLLTRANANQIVASTYPYGSGTVFYSTIPLDFYSNAN